MNLPLQVHSAPDDLVSHPLVYLPLHFIPDQSPRIASSTAVPVATEPLRSVRLGSLRHRSAPILPLDSSRPSVQAPFPSTPRASCTAFRFGTAPLHSSRFVSFRRPADPLDSFRLVSSPRHYCHSYSPTACPSDRHHSDAFDSVPFHSHPFPSRPFVCLPFQYDPIDYRTIPTFLYCQSRRFRIASRPNHSLPVLPILSGPVRAAPHRSYLLLPLRCLSAARSLRLVSARLGSNRVVSECLPFRCDPLRLTPFHSIRVVSEHLPFRSSPLHSSRLVSSPFHDCRSDPLAILSSRIHSSRLVHLPLQLCPVASIRLASITWRSAPDQTFPILSNRVPFQGLPLQSYPDHSIRSQLRSVRFGSSPIGSHRVHAGTAIPHQSSRLVSLPFGSITAAPPAPFQSPRFELASVACRSCQFLTTRIASPPTRLPSSPLLPVGSAPFQSPRFHSLPIVSITCRSFHIPSRRLQSLSSPILSFTCLSDRIPCRRFHSLLILCLPLQFSSLGASPIQSRTPVRLPLQSTLFQSVPLRSFRLPAVLPYRSAPLDAAPIATLPIPSLTCQSDPRRSGRFASLAFDSNRRACRSTPRRYAPLQSSPTPCRSVRLVTVPLVSCRHRSLPCCTCPSSQVRTAPHVSLSAPVPSAYCLSSPVDSSRLPSSPLLPIDSGRFASGPFHSIALPLRSAPYASPRVHSLR